MDANNDIVVKTIDELDKLLDGICELQSEMNAEERQGFWARLQEGYCKHCGEKDRDGQCQCANDE